MSTALWIHRIASFPRILVALCLAIPIASHGAEPEWPRSPVLESFSGAEARAAERPALARFLAAHGTDWEIRWDRLTDRPHLVQGSGVALWSAAGETFDGAETLRAVEGPVRDFLTEVSDLLRIDPSEFVLDRDRSYRSGQGRPLWLIEFQQTYGGLPVEGARVFLRIRQGRLVQFGTVAVADVALDTRPGILPGSAGLKSALAEPRLKILPVLSISGVSADAAASLHHLLVWELPVLDPDGRTLRQRLDAHTGEVLEARSLEVFGEVRGQVHGGLASAPVSTPLPRLWVDDRVLQETDAAGRFDDSGGPAAASLAGALIEVEDACGSSGLVSWNGLLDFSGVPGSDCATPAEGGPGNTQAARDAYYHLTTAYQAVIDQFQVGVLPAPLEARTNQPDMACEARWNEASRSFFFGRSDADCANIGEIPGILVHEAGHAADSFLGGTAVDGGSGEAQADVLAFLQTGDECVGRGLHPGSSCQGCDPQCTGVRDLGFLAEGGPGPIARPGTLEAPDGLACDRFPCPYPGGSAFQGPLGYQAHCESRIASSAVLDLYRRLEAVRGPDNGRRVFEDLWFSSLPAFGEAYRRVDPGLVCSADDSAVDGCAASNWYSVLLAADDDDGDLANGTPNGCLIWQAFQAHGIACGDSPACFCKDGGGLADAGPDVTICRGDAAVLGVFDGSPGHVEWLPGGQTTPLIQVSPDRTTRYTLTVSNSCGTTQDSVTVEVVACDGFAEDFEAGAQGWTTSGLWHTVDDTACVTPAATSGTGAAYYGVDSSCDVDTGGWNSGDLISPPIVVEGETDRLSFEFYLAGNLRSSALGRAEVAIREQGGGDWEPRWAVRVADFAGDVWQSSPKISLARYSGKTVRLRFRFEAYGLEEEPNGYLGWLVDDVRIAEGAPPALGESPTVSLLEAPEGEISECVCVRCRFLAEDPEDGDLSEILSWSSDLDGTLGSGSRAALLLSPGDHLLTGTVIDTDGRSASRSVSVRIVDDPDDCGLDDWPPADARLHCGDEEDL